MADSTAGSADNATQCVVVNITGDNIQVHGATDVSIDTLAESTITDTIEVQAGFQMLVLDIDGYGDNTMDWNQRREGWEYWDTGISEESVLGVFLAKLTGSIFDDEDPNTDWAPFNTFVEDMDATVPTYTIAASSLFIHDPDERLGDSGDSFSADHVQYRLSIVMIQPESD